MTVNRRGKNILFEYCFTFPSINLFDRIYESRLKATRLIASVLSTKSHVDISPSPFELLYVRFGCLQLIIACSFHLYDV